jgi:hypothetical protein
VLTEIHLCHACSCQEIPGMGTARQAHTGARSPLWLKLLAEAVVTHYLQVDDRRSSGGDDGGGARPTATPSVLELIRGFPPVASAVFDRQLARLDQCGGGGGGGGGVGAAAAVLSAVHCTAGGLYEEQLLQLLEDNREAPPLALPSRCEEGAPLP